MRDSVSKQNRVERAGEVGLWADVLAMKHEDVSSNPQNPLETWVRIVSLWHPSAPTRRDRWDVQSSQATWSRGFGRKTMRLSQSERQGPEPGPRTRACSLSCPHFRSLWPNSSIQRTWVKVNYLSWNLSRWGSKAFGCEVSLIMLNKQQVFINKLYFKIQHTRQMTKLFSKT